jgi:hypothetical protein
MIARVSRGSGAYRDSISISARVRSFASSVFFTRPTLIPEMRTSAVSESCVASSKSAVIR